MEKYYESYSFRAFFSFDSFPLISHYYSPLSKANLKKRITIPSSKTSPSSFSKLSRAQLQTNPRDLYPTTIPITNFPLFILPTLTTLPLSLFLSLFFKLQPTKSTERKVKSHLKFHWHRIQLLLRFNPRVNNSSIDPIPIKLSLPIH